MSSTNDLLLCSQGIEKATAAMYQGFTTAEAHNEACKTCSHRKMSCHLPSVAQSGMGSGLSSPTWSGNAAQHKHVRHSYFSMTCDSDSINCVSCRRKYGTVHASHAISSSRGFKRPVKYGKGHAAHLKAKKDALVPWRDIQYLVPHVRCMNREHCGSGAVCRLLSEARGDHAR